jgi:UDP-N-acetylmuramoyl-L-alanyl-D-glutamate--2,6-diaminopimelate ligase
MIESRHVRLIDLFADLEVDRVVGDPAAEITSLSYRSDRSCAGCLFFCVPGFVRDGHDFAQDAVARGASALCVERQLDIALPQVVVPSVRRAMGLVASLFFGDPSAHLLAAGITGTNGKTTSAYLSAHLLDHAGLRSGLMGTVERRIGGRALPAGRTTPEALDIQTDLAGMVEAGDRAVVMEVSSHALDLGRVLGTTFKAVAFTNLTQDHLDYHQTLDAYFAAKSRLFFDSDFARAQPVAVINVDDPFGRRLARLCPDERLISFSCSRASEWGEPYLEMRDYDMDALGTRGSLIVRGPGEVVVRVVHTLLVGAFNVANTLTALGIGLALGLDIDSMLVGLSSFRGVPGRMERVDEGQQFGVLVDYAHTPDSVSNVLATARGFTKGRIIGVLGCGGNRDRGKRPKMGRELESGADVVIITSDNPRTEDPEAIIADMLAGLASPADALVEPDRRRAIEKAVEMAAPGDVVMILGKGHESGQEFADKTVPFDDRDVARHAIHQLPEKRG